MNIKTLIEYVRDENEGQPSLDDQVRVIVVMSQYGYRREGALKQSEIAAHADKMNIEFDHNISTPLSNLTEIDVLDRFTPAGPDWYVISERRDDVINGEFEQTVEKDCEALIKHIQEEDPTDDQGDAPAAADGGHTLREVVSNRLDIPPNGIEGNLRNGEHGDRRERLNEAIDAIVEHDDFEKRDSYGKILLRPGAYRYHFSEIALALIQE